MPSPHIAAGKNMFFWPLGPFFRRSGAFSIRRTFRGALLYSKVFKEYLFRLLNEGFNIEFFIEGTRSRNGKLLPPKLGFLSMLLEAHKNGACDDLQFVPIFIGYDRVLEEGAYLHELEGGQKEQESFWQVLRARKFLKKRWGRIYIRMSEPISLREYAAQYGTPLSEMTPKEMNSFCRKLGNGITNAIDRVSVVTPYALVAGALLNSGRTTVPRDRVLEIIETYLSCLPENATLSDTLQMDYATAVDSAIDHYCQNKFIERIGPKEADDPAIVQFRVNEGKRPALEYYKNNCIAFFVPAAFAAISILQRDAFQFSAGDLNENHRQLCDLFVNEFSYCADNPDEHMMRKSLKAFIDDAILMPHPSLPDTYNVTSSGYRKLRLFARFIRPYFESYEVALNYFRNAKKPAKDPKDRLKRIMALGNRMYRKKEIELRESLSKLNFKHAADYFAANGIKSAADEEAVARFTELLQTYRSLHL